MHQPDQTIETIMSRKPVTVSPDDTVGQVARLIDEQGFHHVIVVEDRRAIGVISDRDVLRETSPFVDKMAERPQDVARLHRPVHQIMSHRLVTANPEMTIRDGATMMLSAGVGCLPIVRGTTLIGIVTWRDIMAWLVYDQRASAAA